jgi:hypothetical protein
MGKGCQRNLLLGLRDGHDSLSLVELTPCILVTL